MKKEELSTLVDIAHGIIKAQSELIDLAEKCFKLQGTDLDKAGLASLMGAMKAVKVLDPLVKAHAKTLKQLVAASDIEMPAKMMDFIDHLISRPEVPLPDDEESDLKGAPAGATLQ
jgi:hypothetical protein